MPRRSKDSAGLIMRKGTKGLYPASAFDAEQLDAFPIGTEFRAASMTKRSLPQHRTYWKALSVVVGATDLWPTPEHLHSALKRDLGYVTVVTGLNGKPFEDEDSTAFDAMNQEAFKAYFDKAMQRLAEVVGFDPLQFLKEAA